MPSPLRDYATVPSGGPRGENTGGDDRDRTDNLRLAKAALSQLSYIPDDENS